MEEINWGRLPETEQVSDDFDLFKDDNNYYAVRAPSGSEKLAFCLEANSKDHVVAKAVNAIAFYLETKAKEKVAFVPSALLTYYV